MKKRIINFRKIESILSAKICDIYQDQLNRKPKRVYYRLFDSTLVIILEGTVSSSEKLLNDRERLWLAKQVRNEIDNVVQPQIQDIIEEVLEVEMIDFLSDTIIERDLTGAIAILDRSTGT